jgi:hypothetical protein
VLETSSVVIEFRLTIFSRILLLKKVVNLPTVCLFFLYSKFHLALLCGSVSGVGIINVKYAVDTEHEFLENMSEGSAISS